LLQPGQASRAALSLACAGGITLSLPAHADPPAVRAQPRTAALVLDGRLDEAVWTAAAATGGFVERKPSLGATPADATRFVVLADRAALWVGVWCDDADPGAIRARTTARDTFALFADDAISLKIDAARDRRTTHGFALNPAGARLDYRGVDEAEMRVEADAVWQGAAARTPTGWTAEFRVPWASLGLDPHALPDEIGLNFSRDHSRRNATYDWALMPPPYSAISASLYGRATHLVEATALAAAATAVDAPAEATHSQQAAAALREQAWMVVPYLLAGADHRPGDGAIPRWNAGVDWNGPLWARARGQATVNTDFAQVDLDNRVVNLTRFSLLMPEKRDFFNKDVDLYAVGRPRALQLFYSRTIGLSPGGGVVPILAGLKLAGQAGDRVRYAGLEVATGTPRHPQAAMGALRGVADLGGGSKLGAMLTHRVGDGPTNLAGGVDGTLRAADSRLLGEAYAFGSSDDGKVATAGGVDLQWRGLLVRPKVNYHFAQTAFRPGVGFAQRTGMHDGSASLAMEPRIGRWGLEKLNCGTRLRGIAAVDADRLLDRSWGADCALVWNSGWSLNAAGELASVTALQPFTFGPDLAVAAGGYASSGGGVEFSSPEVNRVVFGFGAGRGRLFGGTDTGAGGALTVRASETLRLEVGGEWHRVDRPVAADGFHSLVVNARLAVGLSPDLNLDGYGGYDHLRRQLIAQARLRWTWTQASDLFVVWQETLTAAPWAVAATSVVAKATWAVF